ncbi:hypothetical protein MJS38_04565, partial [Burkholderia gladioli]
LIDPDLDVRDMLQETKDLSLRLREDIAKLLADLASQIGPSDHWKAIDREAQRMVKLSVEQFEIANRLQWLIAEH